MIKTHSTSKTSPNSYIYTYTKSKYSPIQSLENIKPNSRRLSSTFIYASNRLIKRSFPLLLFPWLMALVGCPNHRPNQPTPSAPSELTKKNDPPYDNSPPPPYCPSSPPYEYIASLSNTKEDDLSKLTKRQAKTKAKKCLAQTHKLIEEANKAINNVEEYTPLVESLCNIKRPAQQVVGTSEVVKNKLININILDELKKALRFYNKSLVKAEEELSVSRGKFDYCLQLALDNLDHARLYIDHAEQLESKKKAKELKQEICKLDSRIKTLKWKANQMPIMNQSKEILKQERKEAIMAIQEENAARPADFITQSTNINVNNP